MIDQRQTRLTQWGRASDTEVYLRPCRHSRQVGRRVKEGFLEEVMLELSLGHPASHHPASSLQFFTEPKCVPGTVLDAEAIPVPNSRIHMAHSRHSLQCLFCTLLLPDITSPMWPGLLGEQTIFLPKSPPPF